MSKFSLKNVKLGMVIDDFIANNKILGNKFLKSKRPQKYKMVAIINGLMTKLP